MLWLSRGVVAEHSLNVETQQQAHKAALLPLLTETKNNNEGQITSALTHSSCTCIHSISEQILYMYTLDLRAEENYYNSEEGNKVEGT